MVGGYAQLDKIIDETSRELTTRIPGSYAQAKEVIKSMKPIIGITGLGETYMATASMDGYLVHIRVFVVGRRNNYTT